MPDRLLKRTSSTVDLVTINKKERKEKKITFRAQIST